MLGEYLSRRCDIETVFERQEDRIKKCVKNAIENSYQVGVGFVVIKRLNRGSEFIISQMLWHEVDQVLREIGVKGAIGG